MRKWLGFKFDESDYNETGYDKKNFMKFAREFKKEIKKQLGEGYTVIQDKVNWYTFTGFIKHDEKYVYYSISDVRHNFNGWYDDILIRTAKHDKDWTGGGNNYTTLNDFGKNVKKLF